MTVLELYEELGELIKDYGPTFRICGDDGTEIISIEVDPETDRVFLAQVPSVE